MRRGVAAIVGGRIVEVPAVRCGKRPIHISPPLAKFRRRVVGCRVIDVGRVGKRVIVHLDSEEAIVIEPRMTGLALVTEPPNREHLRFRLQLTGGRAKELLYWDRRGLGSVRLVTPDEFEKLFGLQKIGPDALTVSPELLRERLAASRRAIKVALLDQRAIAGIGNLYAAEILHLAVIHPESPLHEPPPRRLGAIARRDGADSAGRDSLRRLDAQRRHLPQRAQRRGRIPEPSSRLRSRGRDLLPLPADKDRADRAGPAGDVFLSRLSAEIAVGVSRRKDSSLPAIRLQQHLPTGLMQWGSPGAAGPLTLNHPTERRTRHAPRFTRLSRLRRAVP